MLAEPGANRTRGLVHPIPIAIQAAPDTEMERCCSLIVRLRIGKYLSLPAMSLAQLDGSSNDHPRLLLSARNRSGHIYIDREPGHPLPILCRVLPSAPWTHIGSGLPIPQFFLRPHCLRQEQKPPALVVKDRAAVQY